MDFGRIVFVGNCQMGAMWRLYERTLPPERAHIPKFIQSYDAATEESRRLIAEAEVVVWQTTQYVQAIGEVASSAPRFLVPVVMCPFLWPYGGHPHPRNVSSDALPGGPYPGEFGDAFLNQCIESGTDAAEAARQYLSRDIATERNVVRMAKITLDQQRRRDTACGAYDVAGLIERLLPHEPLFRSPGHLNPPIMRHLAETLYRQMGADDAFLNYLATTRYDDLVPYSELPVHPSIGRQCGLASVTPTTRYQFFAEGDYTFQEWAERYVRYDWNEDFNQAMHLTRLGDIAAAVPMWERSMETSLRSVGGRVNLAEIMVRNGMAQRALRWIREGVALEPTNAIYVRRAGEILAQVEYEQAQARLNHGS